VGPTGEFELPYALVHLVIQFVQITLAGQAKDARSEVMQYDDVKQQYRSHAYSLRRLLVMGSNEEHIAILISFFYVSGAVLDVPLLSFPRLRLTGSNGKQTAILMLLFYVSGAVSDVPFLSVPAYD
jgi:hypothetical protein